MDPANTSPFNEELEKRHSGSTSPNSFSESGIRISHYETLDEELTPSSTKDTGTSKIISQLEKRVDILENRDSGIVSAALSVLINEPKATPSPHALVNRVNHLESLLGASEHDVNSLNKELQHLVASLRNQEIDFVNKTRTKDLRVRNLECDIELLKTQLSSSEKKIECLQEYIQQLPSQQELDDSNALLAKSILDNDRFKEKVDRLQILLDDKQETLTLLEVKYKASLQRIEEIEPFAEAHAQITEGNLSEAILPQLATAQKAQLIRCGKVIRNQRSKICDIETDRSELLLQLEERELLILSLQEKLKHSQFEFEDMKIQLRSSNKERSQFASEITTLQSRVQDSESLISLHHEEMRNIIRLVTELDAGIQDMKALISFGQYLSSGKEPSLDLLLGDVESTEKAADYRSGGEFEVDSEWLLAKLKTVRDMRTIINGFRSQITEMYTDMLSSSEILNCKIQ